MSGLGRGCLARSTGNHFSLEWSAVGRTFRVWKTGSQWSQQSRDILTKEVLFCPSTSHPPYVQSPRKQRWKKWMEMKKAMVVPHILILTVLLKWLTLYNNRTHLKLEHNTDQRRQRLPGEPITGHSSSQFQLNYTWRETQHPASPSAHQAAGGSDSTANRTQNKGEAVLFPLHFFIHTLKNIMEGDRRRPQKPTEKMWLMTKSKCR